MKKDKIIWRAYLILLSAFIMAVIIGVFYPHNNVLLGRVGSCTAIDRNIISNGNNGSSSEIGSLPQHISIKKGHELQISTKMRRIVSSGEYLFVFTGGFDTRVFINGKFRGGDDNESEKAAKWLEIPISESDSLKTICIVLRSPISDKNSTIEKIYAGDRGCIISDIVFSYLPLILSAFILMTMGIVIIVNDILDKWSEFIFTGIAMLMSGAYLVSIPQLMQVFVRYINIANDIRNICAVFIVISFVISFFEVKPYFRETGIILTFIILAASVTAGIILGLAQPASHIGFNIMCCGFAFSGTIFTSRFIRYMNEHRNAQKKAIIMNEEKDRFLADVSHAIRTPVNTIIGMNTMIMRKTDDETTMSYAEEIRNASDAFVSIIDDILDMSKISMGIPQLNCAEYELYSLVNECYNMISFKAKKKNLKFTVSNDNDIPLHLYGDEPRIRQIMLNLLTNAAKYTDAGSISLDIGFEPVSDEQIVMVFKVSDTGRGIKSEDLGNLFDRFNRTSSERSLHEEGNGLGLWIAKNFVDLMNGKIEVSSSLGRGSTFTVHIPQRFIGTEKTGDCSSMMIKYIDERHPAVQWFTAPDARILVVDDVAMNIKVISELLERTKMTVETAESGRKGLEMISNRRYDLIFMDHMMPDIDGVEALHQMRKMSINPNFDTPVIMLTANAVKGAKEKYLADGFTDYIAKPVSEYDIVSICRKYIVPELLSDEKPSDYEKEVSNDKTDHVLKELSKVLNVKEGLMYCVDRRDFYIEMLDDFVRSDVIDNLDKNFAENDMDNYRINVHTIKSSARTLGADEISEKAKALENAAKQKDIEFIKLHHDIFISDEKKLADTISKIISPVLAQKKKAPDKAITPDHLRKLLERAGECAHLFDIDGVEKVMTELDSCIMTDDMKSELGKLEKAVDDIEFDDIIKITEQMISSV